jgi:predicted O-methyltransferase YrrM
MIAADRGFPPRGGRPPPGPAHAMSLSLERLHVLHSAPAWLSNEERVVLYGLVGGIRPERVLEVGTFQGGSTLIMCAALDDLDAGAITCVDPNPRIAPETWAAIEHRATVVTGPSPEALAEAREVAGGPFDLAFIDGDHSHEGVVRDFEGTLPLLADEAHLLFHDARWRDVRSGIDAVVRAHPGRLHDAGLVSTAMSIVEQDGDRQEWGGIRLVRWTATAS